MLFSALRLEDDHSLDAVSGFPSNEIPLSAISGTP